ncbi:MAG TPA: Sua5/YciO/YrdC/YwlC family protein, partial [Deinococcales bacterium]|nr:Sua5/YciO/YrdC/YwlC family protein [Deinococcales bacterium]
MPLTKDARDGMDALDGDERETLHALLQSRAVALPTETVWGLAARWDDPAAVETLYERKGREPGKPVQLLCSSAEAALAFVAPDDQPVARALSRFWPGPLTLVVRATGLPEWMAPGGSVGLRVPRCATTQRVLAALPGGAAAATSLNRSGETPAATFEEAAATSGGLADRVHPGPPAEGLASTVFIAAEKRVAREGAVRLPEI